MNGMKVATFVVGTIDCLQDSFSVLDRKVASLGKIRIHSVVDTLMTVHGAEENNVPRVARVVVYEPLN